MRDEAKWSDNPFWALLVIVGVVIVLAFVPLPG